MTEFRPDPDRPVTSAARHFGIDTEYAFLIADGLLAADGRGVWPAGHHWHGWASAQAQRAHGREACFAFAQAIYHHQQATMGPAVTPANDTEPRYAASVSSSHCPHGNVMIRLHGEDGEIFAMATMSAETGCDFLDDFGDEVEAAAKILGAVIPERTGGPH